MLDHDNAETIALRARVTEDDGLAFDLGAIEAELPCGNPLHFTPVQCLALGAVSSGAILRLDAITGAQLREAAALEGKAQTHFGGQPVAEDKWYGVVPAIRSAVGPFDRKSQAMNAIVLSLLGLNPAMKGREEPIEVHLADEEEVALPSIRLSDAERRRLRALTPEQLDRKLHDFQQNVAGPIAAIATKLDPTLGRMIEASARSTVEGIRQAVYSA